MGSQISNLVAEHFLLYFEHFLIKHGARGGVVVKALHYNPAGRGFDSLPRVVEWCSRVQCERLKFIRAVQRRCSEVVKCSVIAVVRRLEYLIRQKMGYRQNTIVCIFDLHSPRTTAYQIHICNWIYERLQLPEEDVRMIQIDGPGRRVYIRH